MRDFYWNVLGQNLKPDNPTPQEQALYDQRQQIVNAETVKQLATLGVVSAAGAVAANRTGKPAPVKEVQATAEEIAAAKIENNFYRDGPAFPSALSTSSGVAIQPTPGRTTTVLGSYAADTNSIINEQIGYPKTTDFGGKPGGFNVLNVPDNMYKSPDQFWNEVNKPFLDAAIQRGDEIVLATKPTDNVLNRALPDGTIVRTGFGREYDYLQSKGYVYDPSTGKMKKVR